MRRGDTTSRHAWAPARAPARAPPASGPTSQTLAFRTQADRAPDKSLSAVDALGVGVKDMPIELDAILTKMSGIMYMTFVLDTGCSATLCGKSVHAWLRNVQPSALRIRGFNGAQRVPGIKHGTLVMYAISADPNIAGSTVEFDVDTVGNLNHNLFSLRSKCKASTCT